MTWTCALMTSVSSVVKPSYTFDSSMKRFQPLETIPANCMVSRTPQGTC